MTLGDLNGLEEARIPVGHSRSQCDDIGLVELGKLLGKGSLGDSVLTVNSGDRIESWRFFDFDLGEISVRKRLPTCVGIEAVDEGYSKPVLSEQAGNREKAQGFHPQIIGGKVCDPGVDEQNMRG
jgi:hypothetical protein